MQHRERPQRSHHTDQDDQSHHYDSQSERPDQGRYDRGNQGRYDREGQGRYEGNESDYQGSRQQNRGGYTSADRTYSMTDRNYEPIKSRGYQGYEDYPGPRQGRKDFGVQAPYRGQPGLSGSSSQSGQGYRPYQDYGESSQRRMTEDRGHYGKGPKGYKRSDEKIHDEVCDVLTTHYDIDASEIEVEVKDGVVTLGGAVESRHTKRLAEDIVADMNGVMDVRNNLRVLSHDSRMLGSASEGQSYRSPASSTDSTLNNRTSKSTSASSIGGVPGGSTTRQ